MITMGTEAGLDDTRATGLVGAALGAQPREQAVPCDVCRRPTWALDRVCDRASCRAADSASRTCSTEEAAERTGLSFRVLDYWARKGMVGRHLLGHGSGSRRRWRDADLEVAWALATLLSTTVGGEARYHHGTEISAVLRTRRVDPAGELIVLTSDGRIERVPATGPLPVAEGLSVLHLRAFDGLEPVPWPT